MKYLCLAYGAEEDWKALNKIDQEKLLAAGKVIRDRGALMAAVENNFVTVRAWDGIPEVAQGGVANLNAPLAGFSVIEAADLNEVIELVAKTPCARAKGAIEIRPILFINDEQWRSRQRVGTRSTRSLRLLRKRLRIEEIGEEGWHASVEGNLTATFLTIKSVLPA